MAITIPTAFAYAIRVAIAAGVMLLLGIATSIVLRIFDWIADAQSGMVVVGEFLLISIIGIAGGAHVSVRYITPNSVLHPVLAAAVLGLFPIGVTFHGDAGWMRAGIAAAAITIATIAAVVSKHSWSAD